MIKKYYGYYIHSSKEYGILDNWSECREKVRGLKSSYKAFKTYEEVNEWLSQFLENKKMDASKIFKKVNKIYACYYVDENRGEIFYSWEKCQKKVKEKKSRYKSFKTYEEGAEWINKGGRYTNKNEVKKNLPEGIYFDAGTGRGIGVEVRVTDKYGNSILSEVLSEEKINKFGNYHLSNGETNNLGELIGIYFALQIAMKKKVFNIYGDSFLVINYWSKGFIKRENVNEKTYDISMRVRKKREIFENLGGKIEHISGDFNPADLGFHK